MAQIQAIIFDCFGVLVADALAVMTGDLEQNNPAAYEQVRDLLYQANTGQMLAEEASPKIAAAFGLEYNEYRERLRRSELKDHALLEYIASLRGTYKTGLLSNVSSHGLGRRFSDQELAQHFDVVVASADIGYAKPHARAYQIAAERLGVSPFECVFTDDRAPFCEGAEATGMYTIVYRDFPQFKGDLEKLLANP